MARLSFEQEHLAAIRRHAEETYPEECCGILLARAPALGGSGTLAVETVFGASNSSEGDRQRHYEIDPRELLATHKRAREEGAEVVGYYHSHPDSPAWPSAADRATALPGAIYLIVSVAKGQALESRCFRWREGEFEEETWMTR